MSISCWVCWVTGTGAGADGNGELGESVELLDAVELPNTVEDEGSEEVDDAALGISGPLGKLGRAAAEVVVSEVGRERTAWAWAGRNLGKWGRPECGRGIEKARLRVAK